MSESILATRQLKNGLELIFYDQGNRYFGDYHQIKVTVNCRIALTDDLVSDALSSEELQKARQLFGDHVEYRRVLKQMGVAGEQVDSAKMALMNSFIENTGPYMQTDSFAARFVARRLVEHRNRNRLHLVGYD